MILSRELSTASGGLLSALVKALATNSDKRTRGTKFDRQLQNVVAAAIASAAASSGSKPADELGDHAVAVLVTHTSISEDLAAAIVVPPGPVNDTVEESWVAGVRDRLIEGGIDPETLPIDLELFIRTLAAHAHARAPSSREQARKSLGTSRHPCAAHPRRGEG
jgi:hypothetical protein